MRLLLILMLGFVGSAARGQMTRQELAARIGASAQNLAAHGLRYNGRWQPPGSTQTWVMDCSNAARWFYFDAAGCDLPRTASSQYETLRKQRRLWRVNPRSSSWEDKLKPGDLLFWENTYKPRRKPPITHVMIYLGRTADGSMKMAGSQGSRGVDIYTFRPEVPYGGYNWFLWFKRAGRFVAFGRPL
jgi:cell wall-associated NlpC family hydrolase